MALKKPWRELTRATIASAPDAWGVYELGDDGETIEMDAGHLTTALKDALAYSDATQVRWQRTHTKAQANELLADHQAGDRY